MKNVVRAHHVMVRAQIEASRPIEDLTLSIVMDKDGRAQARLIDEKGRLLGETSIIVPDRPLEITEQ